MTPHSPTPVHPALDVALISGGIAARPQRFTASFSIGRSEDCDVVVAHPRVSRQHLTVRPAPRGWEAVCAEGRTMLVDGVPQTSAVLREGTRLQLVDDAGPILLLTPASGLAADSSSTADVGPALGASAIPAHPAADPTPSPARANPTPTSHPPAGHASSPKSYLPADATRTPASRPEASPASSLNPTSALSPTAPLSPADLNRPAGPSLGGTIGRALDNDLVLPDPLVSAHHARLEHTAEGVVVTDLGSTNGTFVGNERITRYLVTEPTTIGIGSTFFVVSPVKGGRIEETAAGGDLVAQDLTFSVNGGRLTLLDGISFALPARQLLAVVGPSGAGKSTLLKAMTGEQKAQQGRVLFEGLDVYANFPVMRNRIGVVPQNDIIHSSLTVDQTLRYAAELRFARDVSARERSARIAEVLQDLDLTAHVDKKVKKLSGGQRKRVSTAIELLTRPSLLFLDEPTSGLDPQLDREVMDLLASLAHGTRSGDSGRTVLVVTHNETHIDRADKVLILAAGGRPVYYGSPHDVVGYFSQRLAEIKGGGRLVTQAPPGGFADPTEITGFADIYALSRNHTPELRAHLEATVPCSDPASAPGGRRPERTGPAPSRPPSQTALRQVSMLVRRHLRIITADPSYLGFMLVLPVLMGLLTKAISGDWGFTVPDVTTTSPEQVEASHTNQALQLLVILITGAAFSGMAVTIRELVGERDVFLREKAVGLRPGAYLAAKATVLALVSIVQTALMMVVALALNEPPQDALVLWSAPVELAVCCWATAFVCGLLGLAVSALVSSSEQVMPVLVVTIMGQIVLAGGLIEVTGKAVFEQLAWLMPARWGYAMAAATVDMNTIVPYRADDLWEHSAHQWLLNLGCLSLIALACLTICHIGLVRRGRR